MEPPLPDRHTPDRYTPDRYTQLLDAYGGDGDGGGGVDGCGDGAAASVEGLRLCGLLNSLQELLHPERPEAVALR